MARSCSYPALYDEMKTISISFLKKHGYFIVPNFRSGTVTWRREGQKIGSISISVNTNSDPILELDYSIKKEKIKYQVPLSHRKSNLGKGIVWYFICPVTKKHCRKLYLHGKYFLHRSAFKGCMYSQQTQSKTYRNFSKAFQILTMNEKLKEIEKAKYFKKTYKGEFTKRYFKALKKTEYDGSTYDLLKSIR